MSRIKNTILAATIMTVGAVSLSAQAWVGYGVRTTGYYGNRVVLVKGPVLAHYRAFHGPNLYAHDFRHIYGGHTRIMVPSRVNGAPVFRNGRQIGTRVILNSRQAALVLNNGVTHSVTTRIDRNTMSVTFPSGRYGSHLFITRPVARPLGTGYYGYGWGPGVGF